MRLAEADKLNAKLCAHAFYEFSLLKMNGYGLFLKLRQQMASPAQASYFSLFTVMMCLKACAQYRANAFADFSYQLCILLEGMLGQMDIHQKCHMLQVICSLELHFNTSHKRPVQILGQLVQQIQLFLSKEEAELDTHDMLNIIKAYALAPHTLDITLVTSTTQSVLASLVLKPMKFPSVFWGKFLLHTAALRSGLGLQEADLQRIGDLLLQRVESASLVPLPAIATIIRGFAANRHVHTRLFECVLSKLQPMKPPLWFTLGLMKDLALVKYGGTTGLVVQFCQQFQPSLQEIGSLEALFDLWNVLSWQLHQRPSSLSPAHEGLISGTRQRVEELVAAKFPTSRIEQVLQVMQAHNQGPHKMGPGLVNRLFERIKGEWAAMNQRQQDISLLQLTVFRDKAVIEFTKSKLAAYQSPQLLSSLINNYLALEKKTFLMFDFVIQGISQCREKAASWKKIIAFFISSPPHIAINYKGYPHHLIYPLTASQLPADLDMDKEGITYSDLIKLHRILQNFGVHSSRPQQIMVHSLVGPSQALDRLIASETQGFALSEIGELLCDCRWELSEQKRALDALERIAAHLSESLKRSNQQQSFSFFIKYTKIQGFLLLQKRSTDKQSLQGVVSQLIQKIQQQQINAVPSQIVQAIFILYQLEDAGAILLTAADQANFRSMLDISLQLVGPVGFLGYLRQIDASPNRGKYVPLVESLYLSSPLQKYPNVIAQYLLYFSKHGCRNALVYNQIVADLSTSIHMMKPLNIYQTVTAFGNLNIQHAQIFQFFIAAIQRNIRLYNKECPDILFAYAKAGFRTPAVKQFARSVCDHVRQLAVDDRALAKLVAKPVQFLWSAILLDQVEHPLTELVFRLLEADAEYRKRLAQANNQTNYLCLQDVRSFCQVKEWKVSLTRGEVKNLRRSKSRYMETCQQNQLQLQSLLRPNTFKRNHLISNLMLVDFYFGADEAALLIDQQQHLTFDEQSRNGFGNFRQIILEEILKKNLIKRAVTINIWKFRNIPDQQKKLEFLRQEGVKEELLKEQLH